MFVLVEVLEEFDFEGCILEGVEVQQVQAIDILLKRNFEAGLEIGVGAFHLSNDLLGL